MYNVPGTRLHSLYELCNLIITTILWGRGFASLKTNSSWPWSKIVEEVDPEFPSSQIHQSSYWSERPESIENVKICSKIWRRNWNKMGGLGQSCSTVETHTSRWATHKWENSYNLRSSPQGVRGLSITSGSPAWSPAPGRWVPRMFGFEGQQGLLSEDLED